MYAFSGVEVVIVLLIIMIIVAISIGSRARGNEQRTLIEKRNDSSNQISEIQSELCQHCGASTLPEGEFCLNCGSRINKICPQCSEVIKEQAKKCHYCGYAYSKSSSKDG